MTKKSQILCAIGQNVGLVVSLLDSLLEEEIKPVNKRKCEHIWQMVKELRNRGRIKDDVL